MRAARQIIHYMLVLTILSAGLPLYQSGDMNRDGELGLEDAIMSVRQLAGTASDEGSFRLGMENALTALSVAAGIKSVIRAEREPGIGTSLTAAPLFVPASAYTLEAAFPLVTPCARERSILYVAPLKIPPTPPPRTSLT